MKPAKTADLKKWAIKKLAEHCCKCPDCSTARTVLETLVRAEAKGIT
jgi:hypothetical protein